MCISILNDQVLLGIWAAEWVPRLTEIMDLPQVELKLFKKTFIKCQKKVTEQAEYR